MSTIFHVPQPSIDWLTCTLKSIDSRQMGNALWRHILQEEADYNSSIREWSYRGYQGETTKYASWGHRADSDIFILRGSIANEWFHELLGVGENVTRLDLAVTVELRAPDESLIRRYWEHVDTRWLKGAAPRAYARIQGLDGGSTLYVGRRVSPQFGRLYDKGVQAALAAPGKIWRYEVELKPPVSNQVRQALPAEGTIGEWITAYVWDWFSNREISPVFERSGSQIILERYAKIRTDETTLEWLRKSVKPAIIRLHSSGRLQQVLEALGLLQDEDRDA